MGSKLCILARPNDDLSGQFHVIGMNGYVPFVSLNSRANGISNASVLHCLTHVVLRRRNSKAAGKQETDGFALSPLDSALQALPRNTPSGLVEPAVSLRAQPTYEFD
jgi:hypothetical protein